MKLNAKLVVKRTAHVTIAAAMLGCFPILSAFTVKHENPTLNVQINKVQKKGTIYVSVCTKSAEWSDNGKYTFTCEPLLGEQTSVAINSVPYGDYAIAIYQDVNGNGKFDTNFFGIPKEPYAFSNNKVPLFSEPSFEKCKFHFNQQQQQVLINLIN
jgi:uncharacterized protein (DUF2141 family)